MARESNIVRLISKHVEARGGYVVKIHGSPMQPKTIDLIICYKGLFIGIEVKREAGLDATPLQKHVLEQIERAGGLCGVVSTLDEVKALLNSVDIWR